ncbi:hypothetical protein [Streptomyces reniochalinae]|uniref:Hydrogenase expression protein HypF n=1 Tax=Streptomyces reniochalinae TaxID=2250578 RepID=A0A367F260_9ACTN|nr:hypothetical protein [Streptomyces reniochalinae]RCG23875.1 hypothetical protein DQ392_04130 [Streptomyces reniochalinae]
MPGDEVHEGEGARRVSAPGAQGRTGPRHAAPRKPLLTRLHLPAGKAVAIAAMPSAVLMGMGITPQLANAKPLPKNPFKGDSCVSITEQQETEKEKQERKERGEKLKRDLAKAQAEREKEAKEAKEAKEKAEGDKAGSGQEGSSKKPSGSDEGSSAPSDAPSGSEKPSTAPSGSSSSSSDSSSSAEEEKENPWYDPLGLGKKLDDTFNPDKDKEEPAEEPETSPSPDPTPSSPSQEEDSESGKQRKSPAPGDSLGGDRSEASESGSPEKSGSDKDSPSKKDTPKDSSSKKDAKGDKGSDKETGVDEKDGTVRDYDAGKDAGKPFPCPEKADVEGTAEQTPAQVANDPWFLEASSLTLKGLDYKGVVNITTPDGKTKQALKFTSSGLDIGDLHQTVKGPGGLTYHVQAAEGSTSTIRDGEVTMYTEELKGNLFGLIPITFSPDTPPPINVPFAYFTDVSVKQAGQFGGTLTVPGLHQYVTK